MGSWQKWCGLQGKPHFKNQWSDHCSKIVCVNKYPTLSTLQYTSAQTIQYRAGSRVADQEIFAPDPVPNFKISLVRIRIAILRPLPPPPPKKTTNFNSYDEENWHIFTRMNCKQYFGETSKFSVCNLSPWAWTSFLNLNSRIFNRLKFCI